MNRPRPDMVVMIIDDDPVSLEITNERLLAAGYTVRLRQSSLGTSAAILRDKPDVILLDVNMPGLSGDALARLLHTRKSNDRPIVLLHSSIPREELDGLVQSTGADGAIQKTANGTRFLSEFRNHIARRIGAS